MIYLEVEDLLQIAERAIGAPPELRDRGLLASAAGRPGTTAFGEDAYPTIESKAAALLHSLAANHPLVDGNKRLALAGVLVFLRINGRRLTMSQQEAYKLVVTVASGGLDDVESIASQLANRIEPAS